MNAQPTFGSALADNALYYELLCEPLVIDHDVLTIQGNSQYGNRYKDTDQLIVSEYGAMPKVTIKGIATNGMLSRLMYAFFQNVSEGATSPYAKTYTFGTQQPDFTLNAGYFFTLVNKMPLASAQEKICDCILGKLTLTCKPNGVLEYTAEVYGRGAVNMVANLNGSLSTAYLHTAGVADFWKYENMNYHAIAFNQSTDITFNLNGELSIEYSQDVIPVGSTGSGKFATYLITNRGGTVKVKALFDANALTARTNWKAATPVLMKLGWSTGTVGQTNRDNYHLLCGTLKAPIAFDDALSADIELDIAATVANSKVPATVILADGVERGW